MTDRERFNRQMHYQSVDRCFNMEFGYWRENFQQWGIFLENGIENNADAELFFNFDRISVVGGRVFMYPPFPEEVVSETAETNIVRNGQGLLAEVSKDNSSIPHFIKSSIVTPDDWCKVKKERFDRRDPARRVDIAGLRENHPAGRDGAARPPAPHIQQHARMTTAWPVPLITIVGAGAPLSTGLKALSGVEGLTPEKPALQLQKAGQKTTHGE